MCSGSTLALGDGKQGVGGSPPCLFWGGAGRGCGEARWERGGDGGYPSASEGMSARASESSRIGVASMASLARCPARASALAAADREPSCKGEHRQCKGEHRQRVSLIAPRKVGITPPSCLVVSRGRTSDSWDYPSRVSLSAAPQRRPVNTGRVRTTVTSRILAALQRGRYGFLVPGPA
jgi:hypothetical protein